MVTVIIASFKEPKTIGKCISSIVNRSYSGIPNDFEILQVSPDKETLDAGMKEAKKYRLGKKYIQIKDPKKGKPYALRMAFKKARGEIFILTDGDTYFGKNGVKKLLEPFENENVGGVGGRPVSQDSKKSKYGYWGHLLSDSAHDRRIATTNRIKKSHYYVSGETFFPMSGYIMAVRNLDIKLPANTLSDDAYMSYFIRNKNMEIAYAPKATCYVKYPTNFKDYIKQKVRSIGGFTQLEQMGIFKKDKQSRSFWIELKYTGFVFKYAKNFREFIWSLLLFPTRLVTWIMIFWERRILKKGMPKSGWARIESTK